MKRTLPVLVITLILMSLYGYLYEIAPLPEPWNEASLGGILTLAVGIEAILMSLVARMFESDEPVGRVWSFFAWGLWAWTLAEAILMVYPIIWGEPPLLSAADVLWVAGYLGFAAALIHQYRIVHGPETPWRWQTVFVMAAGVLGASGLLTLLATRFLGSEKEPLAIFLNIFYPLGDLVLALAAWRVAILFRGGKWAYPWMGLLAFAVADAVYTGMILTGIYSFEGNVPSLLADLMYLGAYLFMAFAIFLHLDLLKRGVSPEFNRRLASTLGVFPPPKG